MKVIDIFSNNRYLYVDWAWNLPSPPPPPPPLEPSPLPLELTKDGLAAFAQTMLNRIRRKISTVTVEIASLVNFSLVEVVE